VLRSIMTCEHADAGLRTKEARAAATLALLKREDVQAIGPAFEMLRTGKAKLDGIEASDLSYAITYMPKSAYPALLKGLEDPAVAVRLASAKFFNQQQCGEAIPALRKLLGDADGSVKDYATLALGYLKDPSAVENLQKLALRRDVNHSKEAAIVLATYGTREVAEFLSANLSNPLHTRNIAAGIARSNRESVLDSLFDASKGADCSDDIISGLSKWGFRGREMGWKGLILGARNPSGEPHTRQFAEAELTQAPETARKQLSKWAAAMRDAAPESAPKWLKRELQNYLTARTLNIERPERLPSEHIEELFENRTNPKRDGRRLVAFIYPRGDSNGAFYGGTQMIRELVGNNYRVMYYEVESDTEFVEALKHATGLGTEREQKASIIIAGGHGTRTTIRFARDGESDPQPSGYLDTGDGKLLQAAKVSDMLENDGLVLVESCSGGQGEHREENMANFMRKMFPNAAEKGVWSVVMSYSHSRLIFDSCGNVVDIEYDVPDYRTKHIKPNDHVQDRRGGFTGLCDVRAFLGLLPPQDTRRAI
jgi:hypothetical protein